MNDFDKLANVSLYASGRASNQSAVESFKSTANKFSFWHHRLFREMLRTFQTLWRTRRHSRLRSPERYSLNNGRLVAMTVRVNVMCINDIPHC